MKTKLNKEEFDKLSDEFKAEYTEKDGSYTLSVDGKDVGALLRAKEHEKDKAKESEAARKLAETKAADAEAKAEKLEKDIKKATDGSDVEALTKSWKTKYDTLKNESDEKLGKLTESVKTHLVENVAKAMASKLAGEDADVLLPHIQSRLSVDFEGTEPTTKILDASGQPSALNLEELATEFSSNKLFGGIITASDASGSGTPPNGNNNNSGADNNNEGLSVEEDLASQFKD